MLSEIAGGDLVKATVDNTNQVVIVGGRRIDNRETNDRSGKTLSETSNSSIIGRSLAMIDDRYWPLAITESNTIKTERSKWIRANLIASGFPNIQSPVLDFGCGEGHLTMILRNKNLETHGYDTQPLESWKRYFDDPELELEHAFFSSAGQLTDRKYKSIIMYDVIDHVVHDSVVDVLGLAHRLLEDDGRLYVSAHPFSGINGGHIYGEHNKAYLHMLLSDEELEKCEGYIPNIKCVRPNAQYQKFFADKFNIENKEVITNNLDKWVTDNIFDLICTKWYRNTPREQVKKILEITRINYTLSKII